MTPRSPFSIFEIERRFRSDPNSSSLRNYQVTAPSREQVETWFSAGHPGVGLVTGAVSGGLEMLEAEGRAVDEGAVQKLTELAVAAGLEDLWVRITGEGYAERTPSGGLHFLYRVVGGPVPGNTKLAQRPAREDELTDDERTVLEKFPHRVITRVLAETRGEGGYVVVAPSNGTTHPTGGAWQVVFGRAGHVPTLTLEEREQLHRLFRCLDQTPAPPAPAVRVDATLPAGALSPGDDFEQRTDWDDHLLLGGAGWSEVQVGRNLGYRAWRRPGKDTPGISATTGLDPARDRLYVFTTGTEFPDLKPFTKFAAYALLHHNNDFRAAAKELRRLGYGTPTQQKAPDLPAPRSAPSAEDAAAAPATETAPARQLKLTPASSIAPEPVIWAWEPELGQGRIPAGALTLAAGREGTGKSSFGIWVAAQLSRGTLPGTFYGQPRNVFYAAVEDSWSRTLVPRLMAAGADLTRVFRIDVEDLEHGETMISLPLDTLLIERAIAEHDVAALIVDPLMSTLGRGTDAHRTQDVRLALEPLVRMAERTRALTLGIVHFNKASGTDASQLISGSGAFKDLARSILAFARDRESGDQVMTQTKNSLGRLDLPSEGYLIESCDVDTAKGTANVGRLVFTGPTDRSVEDTLSAGPGSDPDEREEAERWLVDFLSDPKRAGESEVNEILKAGERDGFSKDVLKRAKKKAGVASRKAGGTGVGWVWAFIATARGPQSGDTDGDDDLAKEAKGAKGARTRERTPLAPFAENVLPSPFGDDEPSRNVNGSAGPNSGPCASCGQPTERYGANGHSHCSNCRIKEKS